MIGRNWSTFWKREKTKTRYQRTFWLKDFVFGQFCDVKNLMNTFQKLNKCCWIHNEKIDLFKIVSQFLLQRWKHFFKKYFGSKFLKIKINIKFQFSEIFLKQ
jgi:hypothetical protein